MKKFKFRHPTNRALIGVSMLLIAALIAVLWFYGDRINILWQQSGNGSIFGQNQTDSKEPLNAITKLYIQEALKGLYNSQPVTDPTQQRVYFPEARFYVPYSDYARTIVYRFADASSGTPTMGEFTSSFNTTVLPETFTEVPCVQRNVSVLVNSNDRTYATGPFVGAVKLADGRTLNIYRDDDKADCSNTQWAPGSTDKLVSLLEQAKSY